MDIITKNLNHSWKLLTLKNDNGISVSILNYGGIITNISVPDKLGNIENIVLGYRSYEDYNSDPNYFGAIIGRVAGRIQDSSFTLGEKRYNLDPNEGKHHLHGGKHGFHQVIWDDEIIKKDSAVGVKLSHISSEYPGSYPGDISVAVTYTLTNNNELILDYAATSDKMTALTLTNHSYFNLSGNVKSSILDHHVKINSSHFVELDEQLIPTGKILSVEYTPFDFRNSRLLGEGIDSSSEQIKLANNGYDHYFILDQQAQENVIVKEENSGRTLTIKTNQPGVVMYTGNNLDKSLKLTERDSDKYLGVTFETQASPASLHHEGFPSVILKPGELYEKQTVFAFGIEV